MPLFFALDLTKFIKKKYKQKSKFNNFPAFKQQKNKYKYK